MEPLYDHLLPSFRRLWVNRALEIEINAKETIRNAILIDLKDEFTHPRARRAPHKKFYLAVKRIIESPIPEADKLAIIQIYEQEMSQLIESCP